MSDENGTWGCLVSLVVLGAVGYGIYGCADSQNFVPHSVETLITAQPNWLVGEMKNCSSEVLDPDMAREFGKEYGYVAEFISCDDGPAHMIKVTFQAPLIQPGHRSIKWHCTRETDSFTCRQTGTE